MTQNQSVAVRPSEPKTCFSVSESSLSCLHSPLHVISLLPYEQISRCALAVMEALEKMFPSNMFCYLSFDLFYHPTLYK